MRGDYNSVINNQRGGALVLVLMMIVLFMVMITALLTLTNSELRSSDMYETGVRTDQLTEICKGVVISQIRKSTETNADKGFSWASQPGAIRRYAPNGKFHSGHKLYSDSQMDLIGEDEEATLTDDRPPADWDEKPLHYVDLNAPVIRTERDGQLHTYFPIFDPRAAYNNPDTDFRNEKVQGFSYGGDIAGINKDDEDPDQWRVPMPVEWLYVLADGTLGYLNDENKFEPSDKVSEDNPITGRIAFWTDDECCKLNINTASEPTYWATPSLGDRADWGWAKIQPGTGEYQRFPGHPATTALSPVLFPNQKFADQPFPNWHGQLPPQELKEARKSAEEKGKIYDWAPKIQHIGSKGGTEFVQYTRSRSASWIGWKKEFYYEDEYDFDLARRERLYASVDEFLLQPDRTENDFSLTNYRWNSNTGRRTRSVGNHTWVNENILRRSRAFLTAHSRAPETTLFGTPRIACWPIHVNPDPEERYQTHFDRLIARCATLGEVSTDQTETDNSYYFRRERNDSATHDIDLDRNAKLLQYLRTLTSKPVPGYGNSFEDKYSEDRDQILVEMFDYIRMTNLYDPYLASEGNEEDGKYKTFTKGRKVGVRRGNDLVNYNDGAGNFQNGHGHVVPSEPSTLDGRGLGRCLTINEVAMHFICCADGTPNKNKNKRVKTNPDPWSGGAAAIVKSKGKNPNNPPNPDNPDDPGFADVERHSIVYSNFPPDVEYQKPTDPQREGENPYGNDKDHPGYQKGNWNYCLDSKKPLPREKKRIQGMLYVRYFNPSPGYSPVKNRYGLRFRGLRNIKVDGQSVFPDNETIEWRTQSTPNAHMSTGWGLTAHFPEVKNWRNRRQGKVLAHRDPYSDSKDKLPESDDKINHLVTDFIDVDKDKMRFGATGPIEIDIIIQPTANDPIQVLQTLVVRFPDPASVPSPNLLIEVNSPGFRRYRPDHDPPVPADWDTKKNGRWAKLNNITPQPPTFWSFYKRGYNRRSTGRMKYPHRGVGSVGKPGIGSYIISRSNVKPSAPCDVIYSMVPWHGDYRLVAAKKEIDKDPDSPYQIGGSGRVFVPAPGSPSAEGTQRHFGWHSIDHKFSDRRCSLSQGIRWKKSKPSYYTPYDLAGLTWPRPNGQSPHFPHLKEAFEFSNRFGDFDIGFGRVQGGAFINKPDEGSLNGMQSGRNNDGFITNINGFLKIPYYSEFGNIQELQSGFFSPNRMIPSPAVMGSLPSGVKANDPWRTLLFRPGTNSVDADGKTSTHPGAKTPPDHLLLDLFWMPVVEPYAISEPFSTAGKINLNYQILPFRHIRRKTAMIGLLKDQRVPALPVADEPETDGTFTRLMSRYASGKNHHGVGRRGYLYRPIHAGDTLKDFDKKFNVEKTLFRSASQICEMHLVPNVASWLPNKLNEGLFTNRNTETDMRMKAFWKKYRGTSDNLRERPYANLYSRITTQTNTWRIHYRVQGIKKSRGSDPGQFDPEMDTIVSERRGSTLIERYIDPSDPDLPDFTEEPDANLDSFYRFRVLNQRRFDL